jgi:hypothetical protein
MLLPRKLALGWPAGVKDLSAVGGGPAGVVEGFAAKEGDAVLDLGVEDEVKRLAGLLVKRFVVDFPGVEGGGLSSGTKNELDIMRDRGPLSVNANVDVSRLDSRFSWSALQASLVVRSARLHLENA